jgi:pimeloyl-ACP methyl ester carboxylesterase
MQENFDYIVNGDKRMYVRYIPAATNTNNAVILFNSRSLCVESTMGVSMGTISYGDKLAGDGIDTFLVDMRGYGSSTLLEEECVEDIALVTNPYTTEDIYSDLMDSVMYVKGKMGADVKITLVGFSYLGSLAVMFSALNPGLIDKIVAINPKWVRVQADPKPKVNFFQALDEKIPYSKVTMDLIKTRFDAAQPNEKYFQRNFQEEQWYDAAQGTLSKYYTTFDEATQSWKIPKPFNGRELNEYFRTFDFSKLTSKVLISSAQYDNENPIWMTSRFYRCLSMETTFYKVLPNATHLCIWEKARHQLYDWTSEFIL